MAPSLERMARLRAKAEAKLLTMTAQVVTVTAGRDAELRTTRIETLGPAIPCVLSSASGREAATERQLVERGSVRIKVPIGAAVGVRDMLTVDGRRYAVKWRAPITPLSLLQLLGAEEGSAE